MSPASFWNAVNYFTHFPYLGAAWLSRYSDWLRAGRSGDRISVWDEIFRTYPERPWGPTGLLHNGYRLFPGGKDRLGRDATPHPF